MGDQIDFDERTATQLEALYRTRDIRRRRALAQEALACQPGDDVLDVGWEASASWASARRRLMSRVR